MSRVAVIGEDVRVQGFALAGALVYEAADPAGVRAAWRSLPPDVVVTVLTPAAAEALAGLFAADATAGTGLPARPEVLPVVIPP